MINIKKIYEDALIALDINGGANNDIVDPINGIGATDILGKCDHDSSSGYMKDGCFHLPTGFKKIQNREILAGKKKKNHKNDYIKGIKVINGN